MKPESASSRAPSATSKKPLYHFSTEDKARLIESFDMFDANSDGVIDKIELKKILDAVNETDKPYEMEQVEKIIAAVDKNGDGKI